MSAEANDYFPMPKNTPKQKPIHEVRLGAIKAAVWKNETENGVRFNATLSRLLYLPFVLLGRFARTGQTGSPLPGCNRAVDGARANVRPWPTLQREASCSAFRACPLS